MDFQYHSINPQNDDIHLNASATIIKWKSNNLHKGMTGQYDLDQVFLIGGGGNYVISLLWQSKDKLLEIILSLKHMASGNWNIYELDSRWFHLLINLISTRSRCYFQKSHGKTNNTTMLWFHFFCCDKISLQKVA